MDEIDEKIKDEVAAAKELYDDMGKKSPIADFNKYTGIYIKRRPGILESKASFSLKEDFEITDEELLSL